MRFWIKPRPTANLLAIELLRNLAADHAVNADLRQRPSIERVWARVEFKFRGEIPQQMQHQALEILKLGDALHKHGEHWSISPEGLMILNRYESARAKTNWPALALWVALAGLTIAALTFCHQLRLERSKTGTEASKSP